MTKILIDTYYVSEPFPELHALKDQLLDLIAESDSSTMEMPPQYKQHSSPQNTLSKSPINKLDWNKYPEGELPGAQVIRAEAGDVFLFSEATIHHGESKNTEGTRTNLYYNYMEKMFNGMMYSPEHNYHFCMPETIRQRFDDSQKEMTKWMALYANSSEKCPPASWIK